MLIEEALMGYLNTYAGVTALAGTRGYPMEIPQEASLPAWASQLISHVEHPDHDGLNKLTADRYQLTCQGATYLAAKNLATAIGDALRGYRGLMGGTGGVFVETILVENAFDGYGFETEVYTTRVDVVVWYRE